MTNLKTERTEEGKGRLTNEFLICPSISVFKLKYVVIDIKKTSYVFMVVFMYFGVWFASVERDYRLRVLIYLYTYVGSNTIFHSTPKTSTSTDLFHNIIGLCVCE